MLTTPPTIAPCGAVCRVCRGSSAGERVETAPGPRDEVWYYHQEYSTCALVTAARYQEDTMTDQELTLTDDRGRVLILHLTVDRNASLLRILALHEGREIGDIRVRWGNDMLYLDAYDADEIAEEAEVPTLDMHVLWGEE